MSSKPDAPEDCPDKAHMPVEPSKNDVLCGYGRECFEHEGNKRLRSLIAAQVLRYQFATRSEKSIIIRCIMEEFKAGGGRFLKKHSSKKYWYEGGAQVGYEKVAHALRDAMANKAKWANPIMAQRFLMDMKQQANNARSLPEALAQAQQEPLPPPFARKQSPPPNRASVPRATDAAGQVPLAPAPPKQQPPVGTKSPVTAHPLETLDPEHIRLQAALQRLHHQLRVLPPMVIPPLQADSILQSSILGSSLFENLKARPNKSTDPEKRYEPVAIVPALVCVPLSALPKSSLGEIEALKNLSSEGIDSLRAALDSGD